MRPLTRADAAAVFAYASEPGFFQFVDDVPAEVRDRYRPHHAAQHIQELLDLAQRGFPHWGIVPAGMAHPVGAVRFRPAAEDGTPELGYALASAWRGQGIASEAVAATLAWALARTPTVVARCDPRNSPSIALLERLGFRPAGADGRGRLLFKLISPALP